MSRTYTVTAVFACDHCDATTLATATDSRGQKATAACADQARKRGWSLATNGTPLCPAHAHLAGHGTAGYQRGCRCPICTEAQRLRYHRTKWLTNDTNRTTP